MEITVVTLTYSKSIFHDLEETLVSVENPSVRLMTTDNPPVNIDCQGGRHD